MTDEDSESPKVMKTPNAFILFSNEVRREISASVPFSQISLEISRRWKNLDAKSKMEYKNRADELYKQTLQKNQSKKIKYKKKDIRIGDKIVHNLLEIDSFSSIFELASTKPVQPKKMRQSAPKILHLNPKMKPRKKNTQQ